MTSNPPHCAGLKKRVWGLCKAYVQIWRFIVSNFIKLKEIIFYVFNTKVILVHCREFRNRNEQNTKIIIIPSPRKTIANISVHFILVIVLYRFFYLYWSGMGIMLKEGEMRLWQKEERVGKKMKTESERKKTTTTKK